MLSIILTVLQAIKKLRDLREFGQHIFIDLYPTHTEDTSPNVALNLITIDQHISDTESGKEWSTKCIADQHGLTLIPTWISNYIHYKLWDEITYPFLNFNGASVEV